MLEAASGGDPSEEMLLKYSEISQNRTCVAVFFLIKLSAFRPSNVNSVVFWLLLSIFVATKQIRVFFF